jgi:CRP/FNR family cyclic AMP-dependent transcriptional regulator
VTIRAIRSIPVFSDLSEYDLGRVLNKGLIKRYKKHQMIQFEDEPESKFFIIMNGRVKISRITEDGREAIFAFLDEGDFFGEMSVFEDYVSAANATATEDTELIIFQSNDLLTLLNVLPQISINLLREMSVRLQRRESQIRSLTRQNATEKVASTLLRFADDLGRLNQGRVEINRLPAHRDIASMIGTSRETISRAIQFLTRKGYLRKERGRIIICDYQEFRSEFC